MDARQFARALGRAAPDPARLLARGYGAEEADQTAAGYRLEARAGATASDRPLVDLARDYAPPVEVGGLRLLAPGDPERSEWRPPGDGVVVGALEQDRLVAEAEGVALHFRDSGARWPAATSEAGFLDALAHFAEVAAAALVADQDPTAEDDLALADRCTALAGGAGVRRFWAVAMLGLD